ncbi:MAG TPA: GspMb/PilO family protein, partial [Pontiella sp.]|nr:GspMb/PilO family protein [Pontiella sp.]
VLGGTTWYVVDKKVETWQSKKTQIEKLRQQISLHRNAIKMQDNWMGELEILQQHLRVFDDDQRSVSPQLMKTIKEISSKHELEITRSQPYDEKPTGNLLELGINCTWQGTLEALVGFLADLQQQGVRYDVRTLNIQPVGKNSGKLKGNMVINCAYTRQAQPTDGENSQ